MSIVFRVLSWLAAIGSIALSLLVAVAAVFVSWHFAPNNCAGDLCDRLRWAVTAREDISAGQQLTDRLVNEGLRQTNVAVDEIAPLTEITNQYARSQAAANEPTFGGATEMQAPAIRAGSVIKRRMVGPTAWTADAPAAIVPVSVDPEFAVGVTPGSRVVFMAKLDKTVVSQGVPRCAITAKNAVPSSQPLGYTVVSKTDYTDTHKAVIAVRIDQKDLAAILALADGIWRPIVVTPSGEKLCIPNSAK